MSSFTIRDHWALMGKYQKPSSLRYVGGKSRVSDVIARLHPCAPSFHEIFAGGASAAFSVKSLFPETAITLNDIDPIVVNFWLTLKNRVDEMLVEIERFYQHLKGNPSEDRALLDQCRVIMMQSDEPVQRAAATFVVSRLCRNGRLYRATFNPGHWERNRGFTDASIGDLAFQSRDMAGVEVTNLDWREAFDRVPENGMTFLDPPYEEAGAQLYNYGEIDVGEMLEILMKTNKKWLLTMNVSPHISSFAKSFNSFVHSYRGFATRDEFAEQYFIWNYDIHNQDLLTDRLRVT